MACDNKIENYSDLNNGLENAFQENSLQKDKNSKLEILDFCLDFTGYNIEYKIEAEKVQFKEVEKVII